MKKNKKKEMITTFLGHGVTVEGKIDFQGTVRLDGNVNGQILCKQGTLIIGERAVINADLKVDIAIIMGEVLGDVYAEDRIEVYPPGKVKGNLTAPHISIEMGVEYCGRCLTKEKINESSALSEEILA